MKHPVWDSTDQGGFPPEWDPRVRFYDARGFGGTDEACFFEDRRARRTWRMMAFRHLLKSFSDLLNGYLRVTAKSAEKAYKDGPISY
jgi:hypothetical protein